MAAPENNTPVDSLDDLLRPFHESETPRSGWLVGTEAEKFGVFSKDGAPLPFEGDVSVRSVLRSLVERHGWFEESEYEGGDVISLRRGGASITLEPGGQLELSGAPHETIHQTCMEFRGHMAELTDVSDGKDITWLGVGFHPFAAQADLPWVPKLRYRIMREYLPTKGSMALDMMRRTSTVQANLDYENEADALRKLRVALRLSPVVTAMFANSPWVEGERSGDKSRRARVWLHMDPDRCGLLPFAWRDDALGYRDYVDWALDVPMFMVKRGAEVIENTGQTFRAFMADGYGGATATMGDWTSHLNTLFPEARLKNILEVRSADSQETGLICALPALWKGLLYDDAALRRAEGLVSRLSYDEAEAARPLIAEHGLAADLAGRPLAEWADEVVAIAHSGLTHISHLNSDGKDETIHLTALHELVGQGRCPADVLLDRVPEGEGFRAGVLEHARC